MVISKVLMFYVAKTRSGLTVTTPSAVAAVTRSMNRV